MNRRLFLKLTGSNPVLSYEPRPKEAITYTSTTSGIAQPMWDVEQPKQIEPPTIEVEYSVRM